MTAPSRTPRAPRAGTAALRLLLSGLLTGLLFELSGCSARPAMSPAGTSGSLGTPATSLSSPTSPISAGVVGRVTGPAGLCPPAPTPQTEHVAIDYSDFLRWGGRMYTNAAGFSSGQVRPLPTATAADLGTDVFTVNCTLARWNEITDARPAPADGDAAFLAAGTPVAAMRGWPTQCRLVARTAAGLVVYLANSPHSRTLAADPCQAPVDSVTSDETGHRAPQLSDPPRPSTWPETPMRQ